MLWLLKVLPVWREQQELLASHAEPGLHACHVRQVRKAQPGTGEESARCGLSGAVVETQSRFCLVFFHYLAVEVLQGAVRDNSQEVPIQIQCD